MLEPLVLAEQESGRAAAPSNSEYELALHVLTDLQTTPAGDTELDIETQVRVRLPRQGSRLHFRQGARKSKSIEEPAEVPGFAPPRRRLPEACTRMRRQDHRQRFTAQGIDLRRGGFYHHAILHGGRAGSNRVRFACNADQAQTAATLRARSGDMAESRDSLREAHPMGDRKNRLGWLGREFRAVDA
jgi:hypothetical protein